MREPIAREIIFAIGDNMRQGLEPLLTKTLAPSLYQVYLHANDFDRIRTILPQIEEEAKEFLNRQLAELAKGVVPTIGRVRQRLPLGRKSRRTGSQEPMKYFPAAGDWSIRFQEDPNERLEPGEIEVVSELSVGEAPSYGSGSKTQRIAVSTTRRLGQSVTQHDGAVLPPPVPPPPGPKTPASAVEAGPAPAPRPNSTSPARTWAFVRFEDEGGEQRFEMTQDEIVIGRDAKRAVADLRVRTRSDVSRRHAKIRRHPATGGFWIEDLSQFGTEVNGRTLPQGVEVELPDAARISLASVITLDFSKNP